MLVEALGAGGQEGSDRVADGLRGASEAACDPGGIGGWVDGPLAIDIMRAVRLERQGYRIWTQTIPADITPKNRLLIGEPNSGDL